MQAKVPSRSAQTKEAKRKQHQRVSIIWTVLIVLVKMRRSIFDQGSHEANISPYRKKRTFSQVQTSEVQKMQQHRVTIKYILETITERVKVRIVLNKKSYHQVESENPMACRQSEESEYQQRVIKTIEVTDKKSISQLVEQQSRRIREY